MDVVAPFAVGLRFTTLWNSDASYDLFADTDVNLRTGAWLSYDVLSIRRQLVASAEIAFAGDSVKARALDRFDTQLDRQVITAAAELRYALWPWLHPHGRLAAGVSHARTRLIADEGTSSDQSHWAPTGQLGVGFIVRTPTRFFESERGGFASFSLGIKFEAGYSATPSATIELGDVTVGELRQVSPYVEGAVVARF